jgi:hypothetical protein
MIYTSQHRVAIDVFTFFVGSWCQSDLPHLICDYLRHHPPQAKKKKQKHQQQ